MSDELHHRASARPSTASSQGPFRLETETLGALPVVDHFIARLGVPRLLEQYIPASDRRVRLAPAKAIGVVARNLALCHQPLYSMNEWAARFDPTALGLGAGEVRLVNDDRIGRGLERLFDADRASLLSRLVLDAVGAFGIDCTEMHNDSTSVRLTGAYPLATGHARGGKPTAAAARGHSKDFWVSPHECGEFHGNDQEVLVVGQRFSVRPVMPAIRTRLLVGRREPATRLHRQPST